MKKFLSFLIIFLLFFVLYAAKAFAFDISVSLPPTVKVGEKFEVLVKLDSDGILVNSADIILDYNENLVDFSGYKEDGAVIGLWVDSPHEKNGNVYMSGIIPGGVIGLYDPSKKELDSIPLARLLFTAKAPGNAVFSFVNSQVLQNDGKGTELAHQETDGEVIIKDDVTLNVDGDNMDNILDIEKPEPFEITFLHSYIFGRTPSMIIFKANDIGSGIKEYKISEGSSIWKPTQSPQPVSRGIFSRNITVRAYDFSGNFEDSTVAIPGLISLKYLWIIFALLIICCIWGYKMIKSKL